MSAFCTALPKVFPLRVFSFLFLKNQFNLSNAKKLIVMESASNLNKKMALLAVDVECTPG